MHLTSCRKRYPCNYPWPAIFTLFTSSISTNPSPSWGPSTRVLLVHTTCCSAGERVWVLKPGERRCGGEPSKDLHFNVAEFFRTFAIGTVHCSSTVIGTSTKPLRWAGGELRLVGEWWVAHWTGGDCHWGHPGSSDVWMPSSFDWCVVVSFRLAPAKTDHQEHSQQSSRKIWSTAVFFKLRSSQSVGSRPGVAKVSFAITAVGTLLFISFFQELLLPLQTASAKWRRPFHEHYLQSAHPMTAAQLPPSQHQRQQRQQPALESKQLQAGSTTYTCVGPTETSPCPFKSWTLRWSSSDP